MTTIVIHRWGRAAAPSWDPRGEVPLVALHGFPVDARMYRSLADELDEMAFLAVDLPGAGQAEVGNLAPDLTVVAQELAAALDGAGVTQAIVAGLSMGGYVAMALARERPDLVAGLALLDTKAGADDDAARAGRFEVAARAEGERSAAVVAPMATSLLGETTRAENPAAVEQMAAWVTEARWDYIAFSQRAMAARPDSLSTLRSWNGPVSIVVGAEDEVTPRERAEEMAAATSDAELTVIARAGHMSAFEQPAAVGAALRPLIERVVRW